MTAETRQSDEAAIVQQLGGNSQQLAVIGERQAGLETDVTELKQKVETIETKDVFGNAFSLEDSQLV